MRVIIAGSRSIVSAVAVEHTLAHATSCGLNVMEVVRGALRARVSGAASGAHDITSGGIVQSNVTTPPFCYLCPCNFMDGSLEADTSNAVVTTQDYGKLEVTT